MDYSNGYPVRNTYSQISAGVLPGAKHQQSSKQWRQHGMVWFVEPVYSLRQDMWCYLLFRSPTELYAYVFRKGSTGIVGELEGHGPIPYNTGDDLDTMGFNEVKAVIQRLEPDYQASRDQAANPSMTDFLRDQIVCPLKSAMSHLEIYYTIINARGMQSWGVAEPEEQWRRHVTALLDSFVPDSAAGVRKRGQIERIWS